MLPDPAQPSVPGPGLPQSAAPGTRTFGELDALLARAGAEVQRGLEEGHARIGRYTLVSSLGEAALFQWERFQREKIKLTPR